MYSTNCKQSFLSQCSCYPSIVPRRIKLVGRTPVIVDQKEYYNEVRIKTNGRIKKGKNNTFSLWRTKCCL